MDSEKTNQYPYRAPKKYPQKDLHGRTRILQMTYKDFQKFQKFYVNVFGWDMFELPVPSGGVEPGSPNPSLLIATGPSYETWEGVVPGHMNVMASHTDGEIEPPVLFTEIHMDRPLKTTVEDMVAHGARIVGTLPEEKDGWAVSAVVADPSGNKFNLWKCPPSRTWEEPEAGCDEEE